MRGLMVMLALAASACSETDTITAESPYDRAMVNIIDASGQTISDSLSAAEIISCHARMADKLLEAGSYEKSYTLPNGLTTTVGSTLGLIWTSAYWQEVGEILSSNDLLRLYVEGGVGELPKGGLATCHEVYTSATKVPEEA